MVLVRFTVVGGSISLEFLNSSNGSHLLSERGEC